MLLFGDSPEIESEESDRCGMLRFRRSGTGLCAPPKPVKRKEFGNFLNGNDTWALQVTEILDAIFISIAIIIYRNT